MFLRQGYLRVTLSFFTKKKASYYCFIAAGAGVDGGEGAAVRDFNICESTNCSLERRNNPTIIITKI